MLARVAIQLERGATGVVTVTRGVLQVENLNGSWMSVSSEGGTRQETLSCHENPHFPLIEAFCRAIREKRPPDVDAETGWRVQRKIDTVYLDRPLVVGG